MSANISLISFSSDLVVSVSQKAEDHERGASLLSAAIYSLESLLLVIQ